MVIDPEAGQTERTEVVWIESVGPGRYRLMNVPVWAYGLAFEDIVEAKEGDDDRKHFVRVLEPSGLLTVRSAGPHADESQFRKLCEILQSRAVATEQFSPNYYAFAMEPEAFPDLEPIIDEAEASGTIFVEVANEAPTSA
jgi:hypothetical protein